MTTTSSTPRLSTSPPTRTRSDLGQLREQPGRPRDRCTGRGGGGIPAAARLGRHRGSSGSRVDRRRVERDKQVIKETARASVITELIGILDDLDRARAHGDLESGPLRALADKLNTTLTGLGLTDFGNEGDDFDPALHEAVQHEGEGHDPVLGTVMRKGYKLGDRVLRTAMVAVTDRVGDKPADGSEQEAK